VRRLRQYARREADRPEQRSTKGPLELDGGESRSEGDVPVVLMRSPARATLVGAEGDEDLGGGVMDDTANRRESEVIAVMEPSARAVGQ